jgi:hypothetical protein
MLGRFLLSCKAKDDDAVLQWHDPMAKCRNNPEQDHSAYKQRREMLRPRPPRRANHRPRGAELHAKETHRDRGQRRDGRTDMSRAGVEGAAEGSVEREVASHAGPNGVKILVCPSLLCCSCWLYRHRLQRPPDAPPS